MITDEQFVQALRRSKSTVQELANKLGVSHSTVTRWLLGRNLPYSAMRKPVLEFLELEALKALPDDKIDTSDTPEVTDWSKAERGKFYKPGCAHCNGTGMEPGSAVESGAYLCTECEGTGFSFQNIKPR